MDDVKKTDIEILREMRRLLLLAREISNEAVIQIEKALTNAQQELRC